MASTASRACAARLGDHRGDRLADEAHGARRASACRGGDAVGEPSARLKSADSGIGLTPAPTRSAPVKTATTPGIAGGRGRVDRDDARVRVRRAQESNMRLRRAAHVVGEAAVAGQQRVVLDAVDRLPLPKRRVWRFCGHDLSLILPSVNSAP